MAPVDARTQAWLDGLTDAEQERALRVLDLPGGSMADAFNAVEVFRLEAAVRQMETSLPKTIAEAVREALPAPMKGDIAVLAVSMVGSFASYWLGSGRGNQ